MIKLNLIPKPIAYTILLIGISTLIDGIWYNIAHLDSYPDIQHSFIRDNQVILGYLLVVACPLILKSYRWVAALVGLAFAFEIWIYFSGR
jgi:hypothetical protein